MGLSIAQLRAQPLETHSLAFRVLLGSMPKTSLINFRRAGTRELLPTISTEEISSGLMPEESSACERFPSSNSDLEVKEVAVVRCGSGGEREERLGVRAI